jgi:CBS domain-containing protein
METSELMHAAVTAAPSDSIAIAAELMRDHGIGCLVVTSGTQPLGILTDRDITVRCTVDGHDPSQCRVENHVTRTLVTVPSDADMLAALHLMVSNKVKRLPVLEEGHLVGVVSFSDLAAALDAPVHELLSGVGAARREERGRLLTL